jgi:WD40 repeat protein/tetratricopeptide (TPR) repeat protein
MLELMCQVAGATHALHENGILHRDIKPGNIQVTTDGAEAVLMDLGLAQLADDVEGRLTRTRQFVGTLRYASPQQVLAVGTLDRRSDVYSLGATLWELLALRPLFGATENTPTPVLMEKIQREEPERLRKCNPGIPADVEAIVHKCLEKDPKRRYPTALALVDDLHRFLAGEPVEARPIRAWEQSLKWARRRPLAAALLVVALLAATSSLAGAVWFARAQEMKGLRDVAEQQRDEAQRQSKLAQQQQAEALLQREDARRQRDEADRQRAIADRQRAKADAQHVIAQQQRDLAQRYQYGADMSLAQRAWQEHQFTRVLQLLDRYQSPEAGRADLRGFEWHYLRRLCQSALVTLAGHREKVWSTAFSPDGRLLASADGAGVVLLWDAADGRKIRQIQADPASLRSVAFSPDGKLLATGGGAKAVKLWNVSDGKQALALSGHADAVTAVAFSADGRWLMSASHDQTIKIWDLAKRRAIRMLKGSTSSVLCAAFSPDSKRLVSGGRDKKVRLWNVETGREIRSLDGHTSNVNGVAFSPDGKRCASASDDSKAKVWNTETGAEVYSFDNGTGLVSGVAFSPDGTQLASTGDRTVTLWNLNSGNANVTSRLHSDYVLSVAFSPDGTRLASGSKDSGLKIWDVTARPEAIVLKDKVDTVLSVAFAPSGAEVAWGGRESGELFVWDLQPEHAPLVLKGHNASVMSAIYSPDGTRLATGEGAGKGALGTVKVWDTSSHKVIQSFPRAPGWAIRSLSFSPDGVRLAAAITPDDHASPGEIRVWDLKTGKETGHWNDPSGAVYGVAFSPDGKRLATAGFKGAVAIRDAASGKEIRKISGHWQDVYGIVFSPDGRRLATCGADGTARIWNPETLKEVFELQGHTNRVMSVAFSKDGNRMATASLDGTVKLWDATTGQEILSMPESSALLFCTAFRPDGQQIAAGGSGGMLKIWDAESPAHESPALRRQILEKGWLAWHREQAEAAESAKQWFALAFHVRLIAANDPQNGIWYRILAHADYEQDDWKQTIEDSTKAIELNAATNDTWFYRALAYQSLSQWDPALADYAHVLELAPRSWWLWFNRGNVYAALKDWEKAIDDYDKAFALNPNYWKIRSKRGVAEAERDQWDKAVADMAKSVALGERSASAMGNLARAQLAHGDTEGYRATCVAMIVEFGDTKDASDANSIAWTCALGPGAIPDLSMALRLSERAASGKSKGWAELNTLGSVLYRAGRYPEALQRLNQAIDAHKKRATAWDDLLLAMVHQHLGHSDQAKQHLDQAQHSIASGNPRNSGLPAVKATPWDERAELKLLSAEAEALLKAH